ncbi:MAG: hypothetical protein RIG77_06245 [Cyclobacteriaceae bacterium]
MKRVLNYILVLFFSIQIVHAYGQEFPSRIWHEGYLVTAKEDTIRGLVKYDMDTDIVQVIVNEDQVKTYSSKKILYFEIYDKTVKNYRQFYSLPYQVKLNYKTQSLFEVLYEGPLTLLVKEKIVLVSDPYNQSYYNGPIVSREKLAYTYFFINQKGKMMEYTTGKKSDLLDIMDKNPGKIRNYIKENRLKTDKMRDIVRITAFYNSL